MREPLAWWLSLGSRTTPGSVVRSIRASLPGPVDDAWNPPAWLLPHQRAAARRLAARLKLFHGALLADAPGLGKTYVALALATRYHEPVAVVPAAILPQWERAARAVGVAPILISHEALSRGRPVPAGDLLVVDEAHRFRNPATRRYDQLAHAAYRTPLLLLTATPLVNRLDDVAHLLRLFLADADLALLGVRSIEAAAKSHSHDALAHALHAVAVARTSVAAGLAHLLPAVCDGPLHSDPTLEPRLFDEVAGSVEQLEFPTLGEPAAADLMRLHLLARLTSSVAALQTTLRRHCAYLDAAIQAAHRGERIGRRVLLASLGALDGQFELDLLAAPGAAPLAHDAHRLAAERSRVLALLELLHAAPPHDLKAARLVHLLSRERRATSKSIVFTAAIPTALHLARQFGWHGVVVATGRGARVASGPLSLEEALAAFAPAAQGASSVTLVGPADMLIATDLASEGLNLQDAARVVHYDLPWSPLRLAQRLGRIARLGTPHAAVEAWWFTPPPSVAGWMAAAPRLATKARLQLSTGAAVASRVGQAHVDGGLFDWREIDAAGPGTGDAGHAVVQGPLAAVFALEWQLDAARLPELLVFEGPLARPVVHERSVYEIVTCLSDSPVSDAAPPGQFHAACLRLVRARLAAWQRGPADSQTKRLAARITRRARLAAQRRLARRLAVLDQAMNSLGAGLPEGGLREVADWLGAHPLPAELPPVDRRQRAPPAVRLLVTLVGDGSAARQRSIYSSR